MAKQLNVSMQFTANVAQAKAQLKSLQQSLEELGKTSTFDSSTGELKKDLLDSTNAANQLKASLMMATNVKTGRLDLGKFKQQLDESNMTLTDYKDKLVKLGPDGIKAFASLSEALQNAEVPLFRVSNLFSELWTTMKNTARWQFTSGALHKFIGQVETAYHYAQDLDKSLNNIRIVTGYNTDQMAEFAEQANKAAKALSTTTVDYTNASLIYYQQGLTDAEVQQRTNVTIKMANVTRQSVEEVSNQLTAIWNNFYDGTTALEHYADVLTALGAATASSSEEISTGLEKFAAVAETVGLSYEYAATALATVTAETRQSAEVVGTAFRTLFARIQDLELGNTLEDGVTLGKYAEALQTIGVNVLDANGGLKDMNDILDEMGKRWKNIDDATKVAVAQAVGGTRQYAQLVALMDNWDTFQSNLTIAKTADGSLQEQQDIYAEGWEAALKRVQAAAESIYSDIIDDDFFIKLADGLTDILKLVDQLIDSMGGLPGLLSGISALVFKLAGPQIANSFKNTALNIKSLIKGQKELEELRNSPSGILANLTDDLNSNGDLNSSKELDAMVTGYNQLARLQLAYEKNVGGMTELEKLKNQLIMDQVKSQTEHNIELARTLDLEEKILQQNQEQEVVKARNKRENSQTQVLKTIETADKGRFKSVENRYGSVKQLKSVYNEYAESNDIGLETHLVEAENKVLKSLEKEPEVRDRVAKAIEKTRQAREKERKVQSDYSQQTEDLQRKQNEFSQSTERVTQVVDKQIGVFTKAVTAEAHWSEVVVSLASELASFAFTLNSINSLGKTLSDPDLSGYEKFIQSLMSLSFILPNIGKMLSGIASFASNIYKTNLANNLLLESSNALAGEELILQSLKNELANKELTIEIVKEAIKNANIEKKEKEILLDQADLVLEKLKTGQIEKQTILQTLLNKLQNSFLVKTLAALAPILATLGPIAAILAIIIISLKNYKSEQDKLNDSINTSRNLLKLQTQAAKEANDAIDELQNSWDGLKTAQDTLNSLIKGTNEWNQQILKTNQQVLDLIEKYPTLRNYLNTSGEYFTIDQEGYDKLVKLQQELARNAQASALFTQGTLQRLETQKNIVYGEESKAYLEQLPTIGPFTIEPKYEDAVGTYVAGLSKEFILEGLAKIATTEVELDETHFQEALVDTFGADYAAQLEDSLGDLLKVTQEIAENTKTEDNIAGNIDAQAVKSFLGPNTLDSVANAIINSTGNNKTLYDAKSYNTNYDLNTINLKDFLKYIGIDTNSIIDDSIKFKNNQISYQRIGEDEVQSYNIDATNIQNVLRTFKAIAEVEEEAKRKVEEYKASLSGLTEAEQEVVAATYFETSGESNGYEALGSSRLIELINTTAPDSEELSKYEEGLRKYYANNIEQSTKFIEELKENEAEELQTILSGAGLEQKDYEVYVEQLLQANEALEGNKEKAEEAAKDNIKLSTSLKKINDAVKDNVDILNKAEKGSIDYAAAIVDVRDALKEWLGIDFSAEKIEELWGSGKLQKALENDEEAIRSISAQAASNIVGQWDLVESLVLKNGDEVIGQVGDISTELQKIANEIAENPLSPDVDIDDAISNLNKLLEFGQITAEQAQAYMQQIGYNPKIETVEVPLTTHYKANIPEAVQGLIGTKELEWDLTANVQVPKITEISAKSFDSSYIPKDSRNKSSGGGSSKSAKSANKEIDRYHYTRKVLGNIEDELNRVGKAQDRAFGTDKLKAMNEQISLYNTQLKAQEGYLNEISNYLNKDRAAIEAYGATFDSMGNITNYDALMSRQINTFNASLSDAAEESYNNFKDALSQYEETLSLFQSENDKYQDIVNELASARLTRLKYSIELQINVKDDTLQYIEFLLGRVQDNAFKTAESLDLLGQKADNNLAKLQTYQKGLRDILSNKNMSDSDITSILEGNFEALDKYKFTEEEIDTIREYKQNILDISGELLEIRDAINESVIKAFDGWIEKIDRTNSAFEHLTNITNSYKNIVGILGRARTGIGDEVIRSLNNTVTKNEIARLEASRQAFLAVQNSYAEAKNALDEAYARGIQDDINKWEKTVNHIEDQMNDMEESFLSNWESTLNQITEAFQESMEMAAQAFKNAAVDSYSFESVQDQYNKTKDSREQYLDDLEKQIELSSLLRKVNQDLTKSNNLKNQEALRDLYDEIAGYQEQGIQMTQKDLEYLQKRYDLRVAELALEAAQNDMTTMRLRRNSEGGWSYVYTANQSKIDDATDAAEKKLLELRDFNNSWIDESSSKILETINAIATEITAIDPTLSAEDRMTEQERIINHYRQSLVYNFNNITKALQNNGVLLEDFGDKYAYLLADNGFYSTFSDTILGEALGTFETETDFMQIVFDNLDKFIKKSNEEAQGLEDSFAQIGSGYSDGVLQYLDDVQKKIQDETAGLAEEAKTQTDGLKADLEDIIDKVEDWQVANSTAIQAQIDGLEELVTAYDRLIAKLSEVIALEEKHHSIDTSASNVVSNIDSVGGYSIGSQDTKKPDIPSKQTPVSSPTYEDIKAAMDKGREQMRQKVAELTNKTTDLVRQTADNIVKLNSAVFGNSIFGKKVPFDTGGYTGDWGNASGRLAVLHRKELVLNADDTQNFLNGISILRDITKSIDLSAALLQTDTRLGSIGTIQSQNQTIEQQVHITAEFPNAVDHTEIEQAFDNLIGLASQYAGRKE